MKESCANEVEVKDIKPDVFRELLKFIYCGAKPKCLTGDKNEDAVKNANDQEYNQPDEDTHEDVVDLLIAADRFGVDELKTMCEVFLCDRLNFHNVIEVLIVADRLHCVNLFRAAVTVYRMCSGGLKQDRKQKMDPDLLLKLLNLCCKELIN